jgi:AraC-like DNA-binding protein
VCARACICGVHECTLLYTPLACLLASTCSQVCSARPSRSDEGWAEGDMSSYAIYIYIYIYIYMQQVVERLDLTCRFLVYVCVCSPYDTHITHIRIGRVCRPVCSTSSSLSLSMRVICASLSVYARHTLKYVYARFLYYMCVYKRRVQAAPKLSLTRFTRFFSRSASLSHFIYIRPMSIFQCPICCIIQ